MKTLYIIGNGFDLHHDLPTQFKDFHEYVKTNHKDLEDKFENYFVFGSDDWTDFESDLATFDWKFFFDTINNIDLNDENFRSSYVYGLEDEIAQATDDLINKIKEIFGEWLNQIYLDIIKKMIILEEDAFFISFNYTLTLEDKYLIPRDRILHIHGDIETDISALIFGHNDELSKLPEIDKHGDSTRTMFSDSENASRYPFYALQKPVSEIIKSNKDFFKKIKNVHTIIVIGHSLNLIDLPYFREIVKHTKKTTKWKVTYHRDTEEENHLKTLQDIDIDSSNIELYHFK